MESANNMPKELHVTDCTGPVMTQSTSDIFDDKDVSLPTSSSITVSDHDAPSAKITRNPGSHAINILAGLNKQRLIGQYTDVALSCQGVTLKCHRAVLAAGSPYFREKFAQTSPHMKYDEEETSGEIVHVEDVIPIVTLGDSHDLIVLTDDVQPGAVKAVIEFVYTSHIEVHVDTAADLLAAGKLLQCPDVVSSCCNVLKRALTPANCLATARLAHRHNCDELYDRAWLYALRNFRDVVSEESFLEMPLEQFLLYLASDALNVRCEDEVVNIVIKWVSHDEDRRCTSLPKLLKEVRLPLLSDTLIQEILRDNSIVKTSEESLALLKDATNLKDLVRKAKKLGTINLKPRLATFTEVLTVIGGMRTDRTWSRDITYFNPSNPQWYHLCEMPFQTTDYSVSSLDKSIYIIGGFVKETEEATNQVWKYDTLLDEWIQVSNLSVSRFNHTSTTLDNKIYVIGGENDDCGLTEVEMYDPIIDTWTVLGTTNEMESNMTAVGIDRKLYITGWLVHPRQTCVTQLFDLATNKCTVLPSQSGLNRQIFPTVVLDGNIYLLGASRIKEVQMYDPTTYKVTKVESMRYKRNSPSASVVSGKIYVTGGELRHHLDKGEVYNPETNTWSMIPPMTSGLCFHGTAGVFKYLGPPFIEPSNAGENRDSTCVPGKAGDASNLVHTDLD